MRFLFLFLTLCSLLFTSTARAQAAGQHHKEAETAIRAVLAAQSTAWNRGDLDEYMRSGYWHSDSLIFVGSDGPVYGYKATLDRYRAHYTGAQPGKMGKLTFAIRRIDVMSATTAYVVGQWILSRDGEAGGDAAGYFTLLFRHKAGRWVIVADHSS